jgi:hypothetical protein
VIVRSSVSCSTGSMSARSRTEGRASGTGIAAMRSVLLRELVDARSSGEAREPGGRSARLRERSQRSAVMERDGRALGSGRPPRGAQTRRGAFGLALELAQAHVAHGRNP